MTYSTQAVNLTKLQEGCPNEVLQSLINQTILDLNQAKQDKRELSIKIRTHQLNILKQCQDNLLYDSSTDTYRIDTL